MAAAAAAAVRVALSNMSPGEVASWYVLTVGLHEVRFCKLYVLSFG
jgi:hypothetical protein